MFNQNQAIELLGQSARNKRTGQLIEQRVSRLIDFSKNHENVRIVLNNNWSKAPGNNKAECLLGGTTYQYQVWAVSQ